jgi:hypothetical protein
MVVIKLHYIGEHLRKEDNTKGRASLMEGKLPLTTEREDSYVK